MRKEKQTGIVNAVLFIVICLVWGSSFILMKLGMFDAHNRPVLSAYQVASIRVLTAGFVLIPFFIKNKNGSTFKPGAISSHRDYWEFFFRHFCFALPRPDSTATWLAS